MNDNDYFYIDRSAEHKARRERLSQKKVESWKRICESARKSRSKSIRNENIDITLNGKTLVKGTFTSQQEVRFSTITISPGDTLRVSGTVRYS
jgi:hypothetical protein